MTETTLKNNLPDELHIQIMMQKRFSSFKENILKK